MKLAYHKYLSDFGLVVNHDVKKVYFIIYFFDVATVLEIFMT